jgi:hypothetical protein
MYYIINQSSQVVAIDPELLSFLDIESTDAFYKKSVVGEIFIDMIEGHVNITVDGKIYSFNASQHSLSGVLGDITLVSVNEPDSTQKDKSDSIDLKEKEISFDIDKEAEPDLKSEEIAFDLDEEVLFTDLEDTDKPEASEETLADTLEIRDDSAETEPDTSKETHEIADDSAERKAEEDSENTLPPKEEMISIDEINLFETPEEIEKTEPIRKDTESSEEAENIEISAEENEDELFDLVLPADAENAIAEIESGTSDMEEALPEKVKPSEEERAPIYIDIENICKRIGISTDDYNLFLNEYIDTALTFEEALQSNNEAEKEEALNTLSHLSNVLHLPYVGDLLDQIHKASPDEKSSAIDAFFSALGRLSTVHYEDEKFSLDEAVSTKTTQEEKTETRQEAVPAPQPEAKEGERAPIDLSDVKPIHFDFQLEEAAKDLSLPVELIEEFVNDFIEQAHDETRKMQEAYMKGDLETVQKIGHLLKGTSSNLRITPLADTLYEIQFNDDIDKVPDLVRNYWGHFLSLENQIKLISK